MSKHYVTIAAILCITVLEGLALWKGIDGKILSGAIGVIAGLGGFIAGKKL